VSEVHSRSGQTADFAGQETWLLEQLDRLAMRTVGPLVREHVRPWATAVRVPTDAGVLWMKAHTPVLSHEGPVTRVLAELRPDVVLEVLAADDERCWLLTRDAGDKIRTRISSAADLRLLEPVLAGYGDLQRQVAGRVPDLLAAGALDRRSARVGELLAAAVRADQASGGADQVDPLSAQEHERLLAVVPALQELAAQTAAVVPDSIEHSDLHDGNVFVRDGVALVGDFGDSAVSQPLASLVVLQTSLTHRLGIAPDAPELQRLYRAALEPWTDRTAMADLVALVPRVRPIGMLGRALTWRALITELGLEQMHEFGDGWSGWARDLLADLEAGAG
jgi:Phosphotransferase enzyme family